MTGIKNFNPDKDIPSLTGKVIFVTGGTSGLGRQSVLALAKHNPAHIYFTGRNADAAASLAAAIRDNNAGVDIPTTFLELDMMSLPTVKAAVAKFAHDRLDILMCNAGIMAKPAALTKDGFELQFGVNHIAHGAVIQGLLPVLQRTAETGADVRIVCLTSTGWNGHPRAGFLWDKLRTPMEGLGGSWIRYGQSKLANIVYVHELARRYPKITSVAVHPGTVETELVTELGLVKRKFVYWTNTLIGNPMYTPEEGCYNQVWAAAGAKKSDLVNGGLYYPVAVFSNKELDKVATNQELATKLWEWTDEAVAKY